MSVLDATAGAAVLGGVAALSLFDLYTDPSTGSNLDVLSLATGDEVNAGLMTWKDKTGAQRLLAFDVTLSESHGGHALITEHPVEEGSDVTDSARKDLTRLKLEVFVTNAPIHAKNDSIVQDGSTNTQMALNVPSYTAPLQPTPGSLISHATDAVVGFVSNLLGAGQKGYVLQNVLTFDKEFDAVASTQDFLDQIQTDCSVCEVSTTTKTYSNLMLEDWTNDTGPDDGEGARFTLSFRAIRIVQATTSTVPATGAVRASATVDKGSQTATTPTPKVSDLIGLGFTPNATGSFAGDALFLNVFGAPVP